MQQHELFGKKNTITSRRGNVVRSSHTFRDDQNQRASVLPHNDLNDNGTEEMASPTPIAQMLARGDTMTTKKRDGMTKKSVRRRVSMKRDADLVNKVSLDILMDNNSESREHHESLKILLKLSGLGDDIDIGDPSTDVEIMNVICKVL